MAKANKENTTFMDLYLDIIQAEFGEEKGKALCGKITKRVIELRETVDDRNNETVRRHIHHNILPVAACYEALKESGMEPEEACLKASGLMHDMARKRVGSFKKMARIPFFYKIFKSVIPKFMEQNYPVEGWEMRFKRNDKEEISFDCYRCIYLETTTALGCPELCTGFCENDDITFGALKPKIKFIRTKTLANGGDCCDFRIVNGKYHKSKFK